MHESPSFGTIRIEVQAVEANSRIVNIEIRVFISIFLFVKLRGYKLGRDVNRIHITASPRDQTGNAHDDSQSLLSILRAPLPAPRFGSGVFGCRARALGSVFFSWECSFVSGDVIGVKSVLNLVFRHASFFEARAVS